MENRETHPRNYAGGAAKRQSAAGETWHSGLNGAPSQKNTYLPHWLCNDELCTLDMPVDHEALLKPQHKCLFTETSLDVFAKLKTTLP